MRLSQTAEYALRAMVTIALFPDEEAVSAHRLAEETGISGSYLSKVLRRLVRAGLLVSQRGHGGGFRLARSPEHIYFQDVLNAVEYDAGAERCVFGWESCDPEDPCPLHPAWQVLKTNFDHWANHTSLAGLLRQQER